MALLPDTDDDESKSRWATTKSQALTQKEYKKHEVCNHDLVSNCESIKEPLVSTNLCNKQISTESASKELDVKENEYL